MTTTGPGARRVDPRPEDQQHCDVCNHSLNAHDAIGLRFCRATQTNALTRNCICRTA